jgi:hypothetical protein
VLRCSGRSIPSRVYAGLSSSSSSFQLGSLLSRMVFFSSVIPWQGKSFGIRGQLFCRIPRKARLMRTTSRGPTSQGHSHTWGTPSPPTTSSHDKHSPKNLGVGWSGWMQSDPPPSSHSSHSSQLPNFLGCVFPGWRWLEGLVCPTYQSGGSTADRVGRRAD